MAGTIKTVETDHAIGHRIDRWWRSVFQGLPPRARCGGPPWPLVLQSAAALGVGLVLLASGCTLDRSGIAAPAYNAKLVVVPEIACPGERVAARWDLTGLPRSADSCESCVTGATCPVGTSCLDGVCCRNSGLSGGAACRVDGQCLPSTVAMTITASDPTVPVPILPRPIALRGGVSLPVSRTTDVAADGQVFSPLALIRDRAQVRVPFDPDDKLPMGFNFACTGSTFGWTSYDFAVVGPTTSDLIRIEGIRNLGRFAVMLTGGVPSRGPVRVEPGAVTTDFDGSPARGLWVAFIPPDARIGLPTPVCAPTQVLSPLPDIAVEVTLACRRTP